jgi:di-heme oxidoreductase (putative peroxidase)
MNEPQGFRHAARSLGLIWLTCVLLALRAAAQQPDATSQIGKEFAVPRHLQEGEESKLPPRELIEYGKKLFVSNWTDQDGAGRPLTKGTGKPLSDPRNPLRGRRAFNLISGPNASSCMACHNASAGVAGGSGDFVTNAFVMAERFDFVTFDRADRTVTGGSLDEAKGQATLRTIGNSRSTPNLFGAGYLEMLARQITQALQRTRDLIQPGLSKKLVSKGISFGTLARRVDGTWDTRRVEGLPSQSLLTSRPTGAPSLIVHPWRQSGSVVSLREFTNTAYNDHIGIQTTERFGAGTDPDGDGIRNEMTQGDVTAAVVFQATLPVPGRVIPDDPQLEQRILAGERVFEQIGCATCHVPALSLDRKGWIYSEPGPFNPSGNLRRGSVRLLQVDLTDAALPSPRLVAGRDDPSVISVPAYTDFKLHDITDPADLTAREPLDINQPAGSVKFFAGNRKFLTRRLWAAGSSLTYFHHGLFTTLSEAVRAHAGEALEQRRAFECLSKLDQDAVIEFLKSLQVLPPDTKDRVVDEHYRPKRWPPSKP